MRMNSKWVIWQPMVQELCATPIHFYINVGVLVPYMMFYDAKPQLVKTPVEGKPSTISTNHTCQCSLLILSYNISPSHFSLHTTFKRCNDYLFPFESHSKKLQSKISLINTLLIRSVILWLYYHLYYPYILVCSVKFLKY